MLFSRSYAKAVEAIPCAASGSVRPAACHKPLSRSEHVTRVPRLLNCPSALWSSDHALELVLGCQRQHQNNIHEYNSRTSNEIRPCHASGVLLSCPSLANPCSVLQPESEHAPVPAPGPTGHALAHSIQTTESRMSPPVLQFALHSPTNPCPLRPDT